MDGRTAASEIRKLESHIDPHEDERPLRVDGRVPIFAVSASLYESDRSSLMQNFDGWLLKPLGGSIPICLYVAVANVRFQTSPGCGRCWVLWKIQANGRKRCINRVTGKGAATSGVSFPSRQSTRHWGVVG